MSTLPERAAVMSTVSPLSDVPGSAPAASRRPRDGRVAVGRRQHERLDAVPIRRAHVGAGPNQEVGHLEVVPMHGPVQRRRAVGIGVVGSLRVLLQQRLHGLAIATLGRIHQRGCPRPTRSALQSSSPDGQRAKARFIICSLTLQADPQRDLAPVDLALGADGRRRSRPASRHHSVSGCCVVRSMRPVLSTKRSRCTPTWSRSVRCRLASGIISSNLMCCPPLTWPAPPRATTIGRFA